MLPLAASIWLGASANNLATSSNQLSVEANSLAEEANSLASWQFDESDAKVAIASRFTHKLTWTPDGPGRPEERALFGVVITNSGRLGTTIIGADAVVVNADEDIAVASPMGSVAYPIILEPGVAGVVGMVIPEGLPLDWEPDGVILYYGDGEREQIPLKRGEPESEVTARWACHAGITYRDWILDEFRAEGVIQEGREPTFNGCDFEGS